MRFVLISGTVLFIITVAFQEQIGDETGSSLINVVVSRRATLWITGSAIVLAVQRWLAAAESAGRHCWAIAYDSEELDVFRVAALGDV